jgi:hypothetical protein
MVRDSKIKMANDRTCEASKMETLSHWIHSIKRRHVFVEAVVVFGGAVYRHG